MKMKRVRISVFLAVVGVLTLCGSAWSVESSESIQGMISHWRFDEVSGTTAYDSAGSNDGTVYGAQWTTGHIDGALSFDGINDYVDVGDKANLDFGADDSFSISAWIRTNTDSPIVYKRRCGGPGGVYYEGYGFQLWAEKLYFHMEDTTGRNAGIFANTIVADDQWHHVAAVRDTAEDKLYLYADGSSDATPVSDATTGTLATSRSFHIGRRDLSLPPGYVYFEGIMDDVRICNRALSAEEIQQLYQGVLPNVVALEIIGPGEVAENSRARYKAVAYYDNNSTGDVTNLAEWAVEPNTYANIDENGVLTTEDVVKDQAATILASYTEGDVTVDAEKAIDIFPVCPTGTALQFDDVDDYVDCGSDSSLDVTELTWALWIKRAETTYPDERALISNEGGGNNTRGTYALQIDVGGSNQDRIQFVRHGHATYGLSNTAIQDTNWHHVAATRNSSGNVTIYVDGVADGGGTVPTRTAFTGTVIGAGCASYSNFNGTIDEVRIYNRALSAEEIQGNMHTRLTGDETGLVGYWDFDEGGGQIVYDLSGNGNDGQLGSMLSPDVSDPAWVDSDAPIGICATCQIAKRTTERALERKLALLDELLAALAEEWTVYEAFEELLESGDYCDLNKGDIVTAKQKIHSAIQHQEQAIDALEKSIEKLEDARTSLGYELKPPNVTITKPQAGAEFTRDQTIEIEANAWDVDGSLVKVEFFANESKIGEDNDGTDGWKTNWYDHPVGTYSLTAKATDNDGAATTSPPVGIMVVELPPPGQASNPNPVDGATSIGIFADLSWTAGSNAVSHDVYFGTSSPPVFRGNQTSTIFDPGTMNRYTTYYWRIDEVNASGTTTGTVWSFRTTAGGGPPPI
jgi:hypothetical protein